MIASGRWPGQVHLNCWAARRRWCSPKLGRQSLGKKRNFGIFEMLGKLFEIVRAVMLVHIATLLAGCGSFVPPRVDDPAFERHTVTREKSNITLTVAVLTARESLEFFGVPLESEGIPPVWLKVDNRNDYVVYIVPRSTDPNYYSAYEAAFVNHHAFSRQSNAAMDDFFQRSRIRLQVPAHQTNTGFLFTNLSEGTKFVNIEIVHDRGRSATASSFSSPMARSTTKSHALIQAKCPRGR